MAKLTGGRALLRGRRRLALAAALLGAAVLIPATSSSGATGTISVVDYSQCANGTGTGVDCNQNWINGILQKSNSHFKEGDVTPQRAIVTVSGNGQHSITLKYQARKGTTHAYDSLATWNHTVTDADRCANLTTTVQTAIACSTSTPTDTLAITADNTAVSPFTSPATGVTSTHDLDGQELQLYSADGTAAFVTMTSPTHDQATCPNKCADDYATTTISFNATSGSTVEILFGGHLAVSPTNRGGWGAGLGASNISGGPYHIKWDAADGGSVGNRDNQIMGDAIQPLAEPGISTTASPTTATIGTAVTLSDTVTLSGATDPTGNVTFSLWGPYATAADATCTGTPVALGTITLGSWAKTGGGTGLGTWTRTGTTASAYTFGANSAGLYYWTAATAADANNTSATEACVGTGELVTVSKATPTISTTVPTATATAVVGTPITLSDGVTLTNAVDPTGTTSFSLYGPYASSAAATCGSGETPVATASTSTYTKTGGGTGLGTWTGTGTASSSTTFTATGNYYWVASFATDGSNAAAGPHACGLAGELVTVGRATPGGSTTILLDDSVTVTGFGTTTPTGTVTFKLFKDDSTCALTDSAHLVYTATDVNLVSGSASTTANTTTASGSTYRWLVTYSGDSVYSSSTVSNCTEAATIA